MWILFVDPVSVVIIKRTFLGWHFRLRSPHTHCSEGFGAVGAGGAAGFGAGVVAECERTRCGTPRPRAQLRESEAQLEQSLQLPGQ
jgi:hypothetical protein